MYQVRNYNTGKVTATFDVETLQGANLDGVNLHRAWLVGANLQGADLTGATLIGASLQGASFQVAKVLVIGLTDLYCPCDSSPPLLGVKSDENTQWPLDYNPRAHGL